MTIIRNYQEEDSRQVGILIADTYRQFNLSFLPNEEISLFLGPFQNARSKNEDHRELIAQMIRSEMVFVAVDGDEIVGVLRGRKERLASLFVRKDYHRQGIGRTLVDRFERESIRLGVKLVRVAATLYAVPFYTALGYKRSTGIRSGWSFEGHGIPIQPMKKVL